VKVKAGMQNRARKHLPEEQDLFLNKLKRGSADDIVVIHDSD
jgi:hypothetical protein